MCLDRGDWIPLLNGAADDGVTFTDEGRAARALLTSWKVAVRTVAETLHAGSASSSPLALFVNPDMGHRVDMYRHVDGIFDEMGDPLPGT